MITIATPHYGSPLAGFFTSFQGRRILQVLSTLSTTGPGRRSIFLASQMLSAIARIDDVFGRDETVLDEWSNRLLRHMTLVPQDPLWKFLLDLSVDQGAIVQLTPESMDIFNAAVHPRPGVAYHCVFTAAPAPRLLERKDYKSMNGAGMSLLFDFLYRLTSKQNNQYPYPPLSPSVEEYLSEHIPFSITPKTNDGIVPTMSQIHGTPLFAAVSDHLDIIGQFPNSGGNPHGDWLPSRSQFDEESFVAVWDRVAEAIAQANG